MSIKDKFKDKIFGNKMKEKKKEIEERGLQKGDIVCISKKLYKHYGVYIGGDRVIHYATDDNDKTKKVIETSFDDFLSNSESYFILVFPDKHGEPGKVSFNKGGEDSFLPPKKPINYMKLLKKLKYKVYSAEETVKRAKSKLGETEYNILTNNSEHFAIWCKTGIKESHKINKLLDYIPQLNGIPKY